MCPEFAIIAPLRHYREVFEVHTTWPVHVKKSKEGWEGGGGGGFGGGFFHGGGGGRCYWRMGEGNCEMGVGGNC